MDDIVDVVGEASRDSFPASDPPAYTPVMGSVVRQHDGPTWDELLPPFVEVDMHALGPAAHVHLALLKAQTFLERVSPEHPASPTEIRACAEATLSAIPVHRREFESPDGLGAVIRESRPWLGTRVARLVGHHRDLESAATGLLDTVTATVDSDPGHRERELVDQLRRTQHHLGLVLSVEYNLVTSQFDDPPPALD